MIDVSVQSFMGARKEGANTTGQRTLFEENVRLTPISTICPTSG